MNRAHNPHRPSAVRRGVATFAVLGALLAVAGCAEGENANASGGSDKAVTLDFATYNPLSLVVKDQGWLEDEGIDVTWIQSDGSNTANEALRSGAIDVGSTAGSAALLARANGSPIKTIDVFSQPEWAALVVAKTSPIRTVAELRGKKVAATKGTDPYFFLLQALDQAGLKPADVTVVNLQHADGKTALEAGQVDAWSGLDPLLSTSVATAGSTIIYDNIDFNSYGFLNATEAFLEKSPDLAQVVVNAYEKARAWALANPDGAAAILAEVAGIDIAIATAVIADRTNLSVDPIPGEAQIDVLSVIGPIFVESGDVASQDLIDDALASLLEPKFAEAADPSAL